MSNTRRSEPGKPLRQERFASSAELNRGLMGNLVARRCSALQRNEDRELIYFLQLLSHAEGGLKQVACQMLKTSGDRFGTASMRKFGKRSGQSYNADQVRAIREELPWQNRGEFLLRGECDLLDIISRSEDAECNEELIDLALSRSVNPATSSNAPDRHPSSYPVLKCLELCHAESPNLENDLARLCLDPAASLDRGPWYLAELIFCLRDYMTKWIEERRRQTVFTKLGEQVCDALDYALQSRRMVLIDGQARMGKSFAAKAWCEQHPGRARYVQLPSTNDDIGFFRAIAKALGVSCGRCWKAVQLRQRIEETLQYGDLVLVFDEAHYLWPNLIDPRSLPSKINWVMTALVNAGVPVALISTPQFLKNQKVIENRTRWTSEQFTGRIGHYEKLPDSLSEADLVKVARSVLPEGDAKSIELLVCYAQGSAKYLAGIDAVVCRARYLAGRDHREEVTRADIKQAIQQAVIPSDSALAQALAEPQRGRRGSRFKGALSVPENPVADQDLPVPGDALLSDRNRSGILDVRSRLAHVHADPESVTA
jgi:hypothetical protein